MGTERLLCWKREAKAGEGAERYENLIEIPAQIERHLHARPHSPTHTTHVKRADILMCCMVH